MDFNPELNQWLKRRYQETPVNGPEAKRVKFSDIFEEAQKAFPSSNISSYSVSNALSKEFPMSVSKKVGEKKHKYIYGVDISEVGGTTVSSTSHVMALEQSLAQERRMNASLRQEVLQLQQQLREVQMSSISVVKLVDQMQTLLRPDKETCHGPDTVHHFETFSLDAVIAELHAHAPDVVQLFQQLGRCDRFSDDELLRTSELRSMTALCTLLKSRSVKLLGIQLLISFMLIGRATSKQVRITKALC